MNDTAPLLEMTRTFEAPPERVFDAWLSKSWGEWAGPRGVTGEVVLMEAKIGGRYRMNMHIPGGKTLSVSGVYREILRPTKLVFTWKWETEENETLVTLAFRATETGTVMTVRHQGFAQVEERESHHNGWNGTLDRLAEHLQRTS